MFEKWKEITGRRHGGSDAIDPSRFDDPLALETSWHPAAAGGASFFTLSKVSAMS